MSEDELIPELHDIGKLIDNEALRHYLPRWPSSGHTFTDDSDEPLDLAAFGFPQPQNATWFGIVNHHERLSRGTQLTDANARAWRGNSELQRNAWQLVLLATADHLSASTSRSVAQKEGGKKDRWPQLKSNVYCSLWRDPYAGFPSALLATPAAVDGLLRFLSSGSLSEAGFLQRYGEPLSRIPEEKGFPRAVTTLRTHVNLVGKYYKVLRRYSTYERRQGRFALFYNGIRALSCAEVEEHWRFRMARCHVRIPAAPARLRDLGIFARLEEALEELQADPDIRDHVLFTTFQDALIFSPLESIRPLAQLLQPLLDAGFHVEATVREAPLTSLTAWRNRQYEAEESFCYLQRELATTISPPLCEVCQLAQGQFWQRRPDDVPEYLCATCSQNRDQHSPRFQRLEDWDTGYAAWLRISLDLQALEEHLQGLFREYVAARGKGIIDSGTQGQIVSNLRTTALTVDYVNDFFAMLDDLATQLQGVFSGNDVEALTARRKELFVVRVDTRSDVFRLLQLCHMAASRHFPLSVSKPPFRFAVSLGPVHFPFGEHWRLLQDAWDEVTVNMVGSGRLACRLESVPELVAMARDTGSPRRGLYRLADLAAESQALARVALADREERDLAGIAPRLQQLGLDFKSMVTFARLTKE